MNTPRTRCVGRSAVLLATALLTGRAAADELTVFDGEVRTGRVQGIENGTIHLAAGEPAGTQVIPAADLRTIKFVPAPLPAAQGTLVVDNDRAGAVQEKSGKIKLRAGFHKFFLAYWHATGQPTLQLEYEGPGVARAVIPTDVLHRLPNQAKEQAASPGPDAEGFRQADTPGKTENVVGWRLHEWDQPDLVPSVPDIRLVPIKRRANGQQITHEVGHHSGPFAIVYQGYFKVPADGEYTFHLKSDGGSQLHIGAQPRAFGPAVNPIRPVDWKVEIAEGGRLVGEIKSWEENAVTFSLPMGNDPIVVTLPPGQLRELWPKPVVAGELTIDRSGEPQDTDSVYAKNASDQVQRVSGLVAGIRDGALRFVYQEQERSIKLERVVGIVVRRGDAPKTTDLHYRVRLPGGHAIPVRWTKIDATTVTLETLWGHALPIRRPAVAGLEVVNGRVAWLAELSPSREEQVPWFDRVIPWRADQSTMGGPLRIGERTYQHGLCVHSRTVLEYDLGGGFERFHCDVGLLAPEGELGNAAVRVLADGAVLFEQSALTAQSPPQTVDIDLAGKERLTLEVDFGEQYDVGDHVVWGDAYLLRAKGK